MSNAPAAETYTGMPDRQLAQWIGAEMDGNVGAMSHTPPYSVLEDLISPGRERKLSPVDTALRVELITRAAANLGFELKPIEGGVQ